jgi:hypothetical protein
MLKQVGVLIMKLVDARLGGSAVFAEERLGTSHLDPLGFMADTLELNLIENPAGSQGVSFRWQAGGQQFPDTLLLPIRQAAGDLGLQFKITL